MLTEAEEDLLAFYRVELAEMALAGNLERVSKEIACADVDLRQTIAR